MGLSDWTVAVATFGEPAWVELAQQRAIPSALAQGVPVQHVHGDSLHDARNQVLARVDTDWVIHLDADDELEPGYVAAMAAGAADVRVPLVRYVRSYQWPEPGQNHVWGHDHHTCVADCLLYGNWIVVGAGARTELLRGVGGWHDYAWSEDWDLWLRCHLAGATFETLPAAVYRAHVRNGSRNRAVSAAQALEVHRQIARANGVPVP